MSVTLKKNSNGRNNLYVYWVKWTVNGVTLGIGFK